MTGYALQISIYLRPPPMVGAEGENFWFLTPLRCRKRPFYNNVLEKTDKTSMGKLTENLSQKVFSQRIFHFTCFFGILVV